MNSSHHIAKHLREVYIGTNWTCCNFREVLADISYSEATKSVQNCNTIAVLVFHTNYFIQAVLKVLRGNALDAHDKYSFDLPSLTNEAEWTQLKNQSEKDALALADLIEAIPVEQLDQIFVEEKYGTYYRNLHGLIEHCHYHLGQISLLKKLARNL